MSPRPPFGDFASAGPIIGGMPVGPSPAPQVGIGSASAAAAAAAAPPRAPFHVMTKPIGPICNLDCKYCFYLEKERLYADSDWRMRDDLLERYVQQFIAAQDAPTVTFAWQGGEPTLMGVDFFRRVVELQRKHAGGREVANTLQTNGTLLDDEWCAFFKEHGFLIGLSIDGPRHLHDRHRVDKKGQPSFDRVMRGLELLKKHGVDFNNLVVVSRANQDHPLEVYDFLKANSSPFMQFIPLVERVAAPASGLDFEKPPLLPILGQATAGSDRAPSRVSPYSVEPLAYGNFLCAIFDKWVRNDVGEVFVQIFDVQLGVWMGLGASLCVFRETCGDALALEHNGDLYSCDHYVYPEHRLGNVAELDLRAMVDSPQQRKFGADKRDALPRFCRECDVRFACNGECPKHRFARTPDGEEGLNYLCAGYKKFFRHIDPYMTAMGRLLQEGRPASDVMEMVRAHDAEQRKRAALATAGRNDPCPCGSGRKYKKCCGR